MWLYQNNFNYSNLTKKQFLFILDKDGEMEYKITKIWLKK